MCIELNCTLTWCDLQCKNNSTHEDFNWCFIHHQHANAMFWVNSVAWLLEFPNSVASARWCNAASSLIIAPWLPPFDHHPQDPWTRSQLVFSNCVLTFDLRWVFRSRWRFYRPSRAWKGQTGPSANASSLRMQNGGGTSSFRYEKTIAKDSSRSSREWVRCYYCYVGLSFLLSFLWNYDHKDGYNYIVCAPLLLPSLMFCFNKQRLGTKEYAVLKVKAYCCDWHQWWVIS